LKARARKLENKRDTIFLDCVEHLHPKALNLDLSDTLAPGSEAPSWRIHLDSAFRLLNAFDESAKGDFADMVAL